MENYGGYVPKIDDDVVKQAVAFVCGNSQEVIEFMMKKINHNTKLFAAMGTLFTTIRGNQDRNVVKLIMAMIFKAMDEQLERNTKEMESLI